MIDNWTRGTIMFAMQYEITLPAGYDMAIIRHRVKERGHMAGAFAGLAGHKGVIVTGRRPPIAICWCLGRKRVVIIPLEIFHHAGMEQSARHSRQ
jgi:hypothetical protein